MKIMLLDTWRIINSKGGTEKVFCNMANALVDKGYQVLAVACENKEGLPFFPLDKRVKFLNVGKYSALTEFFLKIVTAFYIKSSLRRNKRTEYRTFLMKSRIQPILQEYTPDIIISFTSDGTFLLKNLNFELACPVITMYHSNAERILEGKIFWRALERCECIQTLLERDASITLNTIQPQKVVVIPNAVPQYEVISNLKSKTIVSVGRIDRKEKRQHILIEAANLLKNRFPDWKVEIWGETNVDKKYFKELEALILKYDLKNVRFCGTTDNIQSVLKEASIFAFPSAYEGFPLALTEAMSMGLPAIGFKNCTAVNELIVNGENGILCDEGVENFAKALEELIVNEEKRIKYGNRAKEDMKQYAPETIWSKWDQLIKELVEEYSEKKRS
ncbi:MAG: glycosyltransferase family 4 protein [Phascolarctobacterium sp.]|nr:glycosyltransferase family 4 protein [Phascolarctobacterium sp.]